MSLLNFYNRSVSNILFAFSLKTLGKGLLAEFGLSINVWKLKKNSF